MAMNIFCLSSWNRLATRSIFAFLVPLLLAACGDDSSSGGSENSDSDLIVSTFDDLPVCSGTREQATAYVKDQKVAYVCVDGVWISEVGNFNLNDESSGGAVSNKTISGVSQKGPFVKGALVTAYELDGSKSLLQTGRTFSGSISQDDGRFSLSNVTLKSSYVRLSANGYYRNEVTGNNSMAPITLNAVTDLSSRNTANVNLLTHLEYDRVTQLMGEGDGTLKIKQAKKQAEKEIFDAFHFDVADFGYSEDLDVFGNTEADAALLAMSILLQGDRSESELTELLTELATDLSDGKWDDVAKRAEIADWAFEMNLPGEIAGCRSNVESWGLSTTVPNFEKYVHDFWLSEKMGVCTMENDGKVANIPSQKFEGSVMTCLQEKWVWSVQGELVDNRDGKKYRTVKIGNQNWMAENLNYEVENSYCYNNSVDSCTKYGRLYTWAAAMDSAGIYSTNGKGCGYERMCTPAYPVRGICPEGWHLPSKSEWKMIYSSVGSNPYAMQAKGVGNWTKSADTYGFSAIPAGIYASDGFSRVGEIAYFWSATDNFVNDSDYAFADAWEMNTYYARNCSRERTGGYSVRCVQD